MPDIIAQWRFYLSLVELKPGDRVIDVGCNTGDTERLLLMDHPRLGCGVGLDHDAQRLERAAVRCQDLIAEGRVRFVMGDGHALPFGDSSFDRALCMETAEYLADPAQAFREIRRVLRPGGVAVIEHTDWDMQVFNAEDLARSRALTLAFGDSGPRGQVGRELYGLCRAAGFEHVEPVAYTLVNPEWEPNHYGYRAAHMVRDWLLAKELAEEATLDAWLADLEQQAQAGKFFYSVNRYLCVCRR